MDIVTFAFLLFFAMLLGGLAFALPDRPLGYRITAIFMGCLGMLIAALTAIQLISDGSIALSQTYTVGIYPIAYIPLIMMIVDGVLGVTRIF